MDKCKSIVASIRDLLKLRGKRMFYYASRAWAWNTQIRVTRSKEPKLTSTRERLAKMYSMVPRWPTLTGEMSGRLFGLIDNIRLRWVRQMRDLFATDLPRKLPRKKNKLPSYHATHTQDIKWSSSRRKKKWLAWFIQRLQRMSGTLKLSRKDKQLSMQNRRSNSSTKPS